MLSLYIIIIIDYQSGPTIMQLLRYFLETIELSSENLTNYKKSDFILSRNIFLYSSISLHSCLSKNIPFYTFFHLYSKWLSHFQAVFQRIWDHWLIFLLSRTMLLAKNACFILFDISNSFYVCLCQLTYKYLFTN